MLRDMLAIAENQLHDKVKCLERLSILKNQDIICIKEQSSLARLRGHIGIEISHGLAFLSILSILDHTGKDNAVLSYTILFNYAFLRFIRAICMVINGLKQQNI